MLNYDKITIAQKSLLINSLKRGELGNICCSNFPWKITDISPWDMNLTILNKTTRTFRQEELCTIQRTIAKDKLRSMVASPKYVISSPKPDIISVDGLNLIYDGHHRLATFWLYGENEVECTLINAEKV